MKEISTFAVRRIEFLYCLSEEIKRAIRLKSKINLRSLIDCYSVNRINKYTKKQIRRLLIQILNPKTTYTNFIFGGKIGNENAKLEIDKQEILEKVIDEIKNYKLDGIDQEKISKQELRLIMKDRKISFKSLYEELGLSKCMSISTLVNYAAKKEVKSSFSKSRKKTKAKLKKQEKMFEIMQKCNKTIMNEIFALIEKPKEESTAEFQEKIKLIDKLMTLSGEATKIKKQVAKIHWGQVVEIDACQHRWFGTKQKHVYLAVEKSSRVLLAYHIEEQETTAGYVTLLTKLFKTYGVPKAIYTDKRTTFWKCSSDGTSNTPLAQCLQKLGCLLMSSSNPNFKPMVENAFGVLQNSWVYKAYKNQISTLEEYIPFFEKQMEEYNKNKLSKKSKEKNFFTTVTDAELESKLINRFSRTITRGLTVMIENKHYGLPKNECGVAFTKPGNIVSIYESYFNQGEYWIKYGTTKIMLAEIDFEYSEDEYIKRLNQYNEKWKNKRDKSKLCVY